MLPGHSLTPHLANAPRSGHPRHIAAREGARENSLTHWRNLPRGSTGPRANSSPMPTIIEYTDTKLARNRYPRSITSPSHASPCCQLHMEPIGTPFLEGRSEIQYKRCRRCGFTVRLILRQLPDAQLVAALRKELTSAFVRNSP